MAAHYLWGHVVWGPYHCECSALAFLQLFGYAKIYQLEIALPVQHHIFRLQI